jgi:pyridoxamine 5'-phosphate oxidase
MRKEYGGRALSKSSAGAEPFRQFELWFEEAVRSEVDEPSAMFLATVAKNGVPSGRVVLLKGFSEKGFIFFTNYNSAKGKDIGSNPAVAMVFHWKELERQVRITGKAKKISAEESDEYFRSRPFESRVSASVSPQSTVIPSRGFLEKERDKFLEVMKDNELPRPLHWGGYIVKPDKIEFWQGRESRLHDRILYTRKKEEWIIERLAP